MLEISCYSKIPSKTYKQTNLGFEARDCDMFWLYRAELYTVPLCTVTWVRLSGLRKRGFTTKIGE